MPSLPLNPPSSTRAVLDSPGVLRPLETLSLATIPLFDKLTDAQIEALRNLLSFEDFRQGDVVIAQGQHSLDRIFIIVDGEASLRKTGRSPLTQEPLEYEIEVRGKGDIFGAMSVLDGEPAPVTMMAKTPLRLAVLDLKPNGRDGVSRTIRNILIAELRRTLANYVRDSLDKRVDSLRQEAEFSGYRNAVGGIVIAALSLLSFYTLALGTLPSFESYLNVNFALSPFIIVLFAAIFFPVIRKSGFPSAFFGLSLHNWRPALIFSITASLAFIAFGALVKWATIAAIPSLAGMTVISFADIRVGNAPVMMSPWYWLAVSLYLLLTPLQEFVARCGIQAPLYAFLQGGEWKRRASSIIVSNLVFAAAHAHISLEFALAAFLPGIFWGWIFARTNSLLAVSVSHFLIGGAGIFLFGIEELVSKLL